MFNVKLYSVRPFLPLWVRVNLVRALVIPLIAYGCEAYAGCTGVEFGRLQRSFNSAVRFIYSLGRRDHVSPSTHRFLGCSFYNFLCLRTMALLFRILSTKLPIYLYQRFMFVRSGRTKQLQMPQFRSRIMELSFQVRAARLWNKLPQSDRFLGSPSSFKERCLRMLNARR